MDVESLDYLIMFLICESDSKGVYEIEESYVFVNGKS